MWDNTSLIDIYIFTQVVITLNIAMKQKYSMKSLQITGIIHVEVL